MVENCKVRHDKIQHTAWNCENDIR